MTAADVADAVASIAADVVDEAVSRMDRTEAVSEEGAEETEVFIGNHIVLHVGIGNY